MLIQGKPDLTAITNYLTLTGPVKFSMSSILGTTASSSSSAPSTPLLKAALTSSPLGSLGSSVVTSTTASATVTSEAASGNLEIDIDEDYDA